MKTRYYTLLITIAPLLCLCSIAVFNYAIDPYQIFTSNREAIYHDKPALHANMRMHKTYQVKLQKPDSLILGSSKAIQGIPTQHALFENQRVYNLAVPLASMKELTYLLRHAQANHAIESVVLALDFLSFNTRARTDGPAAGFQTARLDGHAQSKHYYWQDYLSALFSLDALSAAFESRRVSKRIGLESQPNSGNSRIAQIGQDEQDSHRVLTALGGREDAEVRSRLTDGGHRSNTLKIEEFFTNAVYLPTPHREYNFSTSTEDSLYWFEQFLSTVHEHDIAVNLLISPSHARLNELIFQAGLWTKFEQWKRALNNTNQLLAVQLGRQALPLWDFSLPGSITTEPFPQVGDSTTQMQYYYEAIHFNQKTGRLILDRLKDHVSPDNKSTETAESFGVRLDSENIDQVLSTIRDTQLSFRIRYPEYVEELKNIIELPES